MFSFLLCVSVNVNVNVNANLIGGRIYTHLPATSLVKRYPHRLLSVPPPSSSSASSSPLSGDPISIMASNSLRVAAAQMTSINDLAANFATCSRLVKVFSFSSQSFALSPSISSGSPLFFTIFVLFSCPHLLLAVVYMFPLDNRILHVLLF